MVGEYPPFDGTWRLLMRADATFWSSDGTSTVGNHIYQTASGVWMNNDGWQSYPISYAGSVSQTQGWTGEKLPTAIEQVKTILMTEPEILSPTATPTPTGILTADIPKTPAAQTVKNFVSGFTFIPLFIIGIVLFLVIFIFKRR